MTKLTQKIQYEYQATSDSFLQHDRPFIGWATVDNLKLDNKICSVERVIRMYY